MELSGLIFVALALVWAVVLIPKALKHHDDLAETRSVDEVSEGMRVLARREAVSATSSRLVVTVADAAPAAEQAPAARRVPSARAHRAAAAAAARRRRRVLVVLLVTTAGIGGLSVAGLVPGWAPAVSATLVAGFLVVARMTVRREHARWATLVATRQAAEDASAAEASSHVGADAAAPETVVGPVVGTVVGPVVGPVVGAADDPVAGTGRDGAPVLPRSLDDTQAIPAAAALLPDAEPTADSASLWDPLPVTLPTYVGKPRATRSVRTIDLSAPDVASAGRDAAASALVAEAATTGGPESPPQRAVGS